MEYLIAICLGLGLSVACGIKAFLPAFAVSLVTYFGIVPVNSDFAWIASPTALTLLGVATLSETICTCFPVVGNLQKSFSPLVALICGAFITFSVLPEMNEAFSWTLSAISGATALGVATGDTAMRSAMTVSTGGASEFVYGPAEVGASLGVTLMTIFIPILTVVGLIIVLPILAFLAYKLIKKLRSKHKKFEILNTQENGTVI